MTWKEAAGVAGLCGLSILTACAKVPQVAPGAPAHVYFEPKDAEDAYTIRVTAADGKVSGCQTPCELDVASGTAQVEVTGKKTYQTEVVIPEGPSRAQVDHRGVGGTVLGYTGAVVGGGLLFIGAVGGVGMAVIAGVLVGGGGAVGYFTAGSNSVSVEPSQPAGQSGVGQPPPMATAAEIQPPPAAPEPAEPPAQQEPEPAEDEAQPSDADAEPGAEEATPPEPAEPESPDGKARVQVQNIMEGEFRAGDYRQAEVRLYETYNACGTDCNATTRSLIWMYIGIVRGTGKGDQVRARQAFGRMLDFDETMTVNSMLADEATLRTFEELLRKRQRR